MPAARLAVQSADRRGGRAPAKLPVRAHVVAIEDGLIRVELSTDKPNLPPDIRARLGDGANR